MILHQLSLYSMGSSSLIAEMSSTIVLIHSRANMLLFFCFQGANRLPILINHICHMVSIKFILRNCSILSRVKSRRGKNDCSVVVIYSGAVRRKRVSEQVTPVEARTITGTSDIKYGSRGGEAPKSHLRVASSPSIGRFGWQSRDYPC